MDTTLPIPFELYPHEAPRKSRWSSVALSLSVHLAAVAILAVLHFETAPSAFTRPRSVTLIAPTPLDLRPYRPEPAKAPRAKQDLPAPPALENPSSATPDHAPVRTARAFASPPPKVLRQSPIATLELPVAPIEVPVTPPLTTAHLPVLPAPPLKTDNFAAVEKASAAPAAPKTSPSMIGGFSSTAIAERSGASSRSSLSTGAFGGTGGMSQTAVAARIATTGTFASTTLDRITEKSGTTNPARASGFGDAQVAAAPVASMKTHAKGDTPVEILEKLNPAYTDEARRLHIEGEVLIEILFPATGPARVLRVLHTLGHGLDENAVAAAQSIRFRPATQGGQAVDSTAVVHIAFQVAY